MKLRTKFALLLLVLTLVLSVATYAGLETYKDQQVAEANADVSETARLAADQIDSRLGDHRDYVAYVAQRATATNNDSALVAELLANSRFFAAQVVTADRTTVVVQGPYPEDRRREMLDSSGLSTCVEQTLTTGDICTSDPSMSSPDGYHFVVVSAPIIHDGNVVGVLSAALPLNGPTVFSLLDPLQRDSQTVSVTHDGTSLYDRETSFDQRISARATVDSTGWTVSVQRDRSALLQEMRTLAYAQALGILLIGLFAVVIGYWEYRVTLSQTNRLLSAFQSLENNDYDTRLSLTASEEWLQISDGFNNLARTLAVRETELRTQRQRLEVLNRVLRHNLRNEMNLVLGFAEQVTDGDAEAETAAEGIQRAAQNLLETGRKARRVEAALARNDPPQPLDVVPFVREAVEDARKANPDVDIDLSVPPSLSVTGRPVLEQALQELIQNACDHAETDDLHVSVTAERTDGGTTITVSDDGPGIPDHERAALEEGTETALRHSSGLGLWAATWIVEECDGELSFDDCEEGTTVRIRLDSAPDG